jgi:transmembrane sensor
MSDFNRKMENARHALVPRWNPERAKEVHGAMHALARRRRTRVRVAMAGCAALVILGLGWRQLPRVLPNYPSSVQTVADHTIRLEDGSSIVPRDEHTVLTVRNVSPDQVKLALDLGAAHLSVTARPGRVLRVDAGAVALESRGGGFTVDREGDRVRVSVDQGRVRVLWGVEETLLEAGQSDEFPKAVAQPAPSTSAMVAPAASTVVPVPLPSAHVAPSPSSLFWRQPAQEGDYDTAFQALHEAGPQAVRDEAGDLLLAADVARLSHHPGEAVAPLQRVIANHSDDPRAPLAAFTLGRVLLDELGRPTEAAGAFAQARALGAGGPLEEDALAREVEAWARGGDSTRAHATAEEYVARYPTGRRLHAVRRFGGFE